jgi:hypothetical protein
MSKYKIDFTLNELITMKMVVDKELEQVNKDIVNTKSEISEPQVRASWYSKSLIDNLDFLISKRKDLTSLIEKYVKSNEYLVYSPDHVRQDVL